MENQTNSNDNGVYVRDAYAEGWQPEAKCYSFQSFTTPVSQHSISLGCIPPPTVVPIVFVPGIMGSNLKAKVDILDGKKEVAILSQTPIWRVDSAASLAGEWLHRKQDQYQLRFQHAKVAVDTRGKIEVNTTAQTTRYAGLTEAQARARGWGGVAAAFYGNFLDWLDGQLNRHRREATGSGGALRDNSALTSLKQTAIHNPMGVAEGKPGKPLSPDDLDILLRVDNPVHAFGYNWLQSNLDSGKELANFINATIRTYTDARRRCERVILVTHSMGGLVARAACTVGGAGSQVAGVFHGVMPTDGAAATYKRMVSGFGGEPSHGLDGWIKDWIGSNALGPTGDYVTPSLALNPGPLELLPNARYNAGKPWLRVVDASGAVLKELPTAGGDPYADIYLDQDGWWRLLNVEWLNPAKLQTGNGFDDYGKAVGRAQQFHTSVQSAGDFHPVTHAHYGMDSDHLAYATITWKLAREVDAERNSRLQRERLPNVEPMTGTHIYLREGDWGVHARLSEPDAPGDGTVPAGASAMAVDQAVHAGNLLVRGSGYAHDASYDLGSPSEGPHAAVQAIVRMLQATVTAAT